MSACSDEPETVDPVSLAQDIQFRVGGQTFVLPRVAVGRRWQDSKDGFLTRSPFDGFEIFIHVYGSTGEQLASRAICPRLTRQWSQLICLSSYTPLYQSLPRTITIQRLSAVEAYRHNSYPGGQTQYDLISTIPFEKARAHRACTNAIHSGHRFCIAGILLKNGLAALWEAGEDDDDDMRAGHMVQTFVEDAIGARENFDALEREAVLRRDPRAPCYDDEPYDREAMSRVRDYEGLAHCPTRR